MNDISPENPTPTQAAKTDKPGNWLSQNYMPVLFVAGVVGVIVWRGLYVGDVVLAALGLGTVIFLHELGHFLAAKFCDVHVETFSIGFGKPIPGCQFRYGETTYKLGWIPLGGYVKMIGEGDNADSDEAEEDPRSFKNKKVYQRMLIISAGVIMNLILGISCFIVAYSHGVEEAPGIIGYISPGSPAWQAGIRADSVVLQIGGIEKPTYPDIRTKVMSSSRKDIIPIRIKQRDGSEVTIDVVPRRDEGELFPMIGIGSTEQLTLAKAGRKGEVRIAIPGSAASNAKTAGDVGFMPGDRLIATSDPENPAVMKDLPVDQRDPSGKKLDFFEFRDRMQLMRDKTVTVRVDRNGQSIDIPVNPEPTLILPGVRLQIGRISALRVNSPATQAKPVEGATEPGLVAINPDVPDSGDRLIAVEITKPGGQKKRFVDIPNPKMEDKVQEVILDPARLPYELSEWAEEWIRHPRYSEPLKFPPVRVTVMRSPTDASQKTPRRCGYDLEWDPSYRFSYEPVISSNSPLTIPGLGIAYQVETTIDDVTKGSAAEVAGLKKSDVIIAARHKYITLQNKSEDSDWIPLKQHQGAILSFFVARMDAPELELKIRRPVENENRFEDLEFKLTAVRDATWPQNERGFKFEADTRTQKAEDFWEAVQFGGQRTVRLIRTIYQQLYALASGNISVKSMNGPLSIADISYKIVGHDMWTFIVFIGMISLNLAVVNFLPVPVLDGGHMVFLIYEWIRGKPAPEKLMEWSMYLGLGMIFSLMFFVIYLDVRRLFF
ncbi:RIP metalloprotease RseP [Zavarzinella formosa]|uniref:RIP metalloprotease RseP n=1 Tax=Zavarzinella formosa TaxID=360055 RepID=UPI000313AE1F|nr:RIP metalloprotease RseP [Zavarzinella formosa]